MPWNLEVADVVAVGTAVNFYNFALVKVASQVVISQDVVLCTGTHDYEHPHMPLRSAPIEILGHAWIASGAFLGPKVTAGAGAVVGARAVLTKDAPEWTVVAGNPARRKAAPSEAGMISTIILTKNEEAVIGDCLASLRWCDDVWVYDYLDRIAQLGGHLGRTNDPPPGNIVMSRARQAHRPRDWFRRDMWVIERSAGGSPPLLVPIAAGCLPPRGAGVLLRITRKAAVWEKGGSIDVAI